MEAIFLGCGAGGPQLKRNPLGCTVTYSFTLTDTVAATYRDLRHDPRALPSCCLVPLGTIYWPDEHPNGRPNFGSFDQDSRASLLRLIAARLAYWKSGEIPAELLQLWAEARDLIPDWPGFRRLTLTNGERTLAVECEQSAQEWFDALAEAAGGVVETDQGGGLSGWSATIRLRDDNPKTGPGSHGAA